MALVLSGEMASAYFIGHAPQGFWTVLNMGTDAVIFCFLWLYISAAGPGPWAHGCPVESASRDHPAGRRQVVVIRHVRFQTAVWQRLRVARHELRIPVINGEVERIR